VFKTYLSFILMTYAQNQRLSKQITPWSCNWQVYRICEAPELQTCTYTSMLR